MTFPNDSIPENDVINSTSLFETNYDNFTTAPDESESNASYTSDWTTEVYNSITEEANTEMENGINNLSLPIDYENFSILRAVDEQTSPSPASMNGTELSITPNMYDYDYDEYYSLGNNLSASEETDLANHTRNTSINEEIENYRFKRQNDYADVFSSRYIPPVIYSDTYDEEPSTSTQPSDTTRRTVDELEHSVNTHDYVVSGVSNTTENVTENTVDAYLNHTTEPSSSDHHLPTANDHPITDENLHGRYSSTSPPLILNPGTIVGDCYRLVCFGGKYELK